MTDCCTTVFPSLILASRRHLRSASRHHLVVPRHNLSTYGRRAFAVAGPAAWNSLSDDPRLALTVSDVCLTLVPPTGGIFTLQCSFSRKSPTKQCTKTVSFRDIATDPFGFLTPYLSVSLYLLPVLRGRSASNVHETGFPTIQQ